VAYPGVGCPVTGAGFGSSAFYCALASSIDTLRAIARSGSKSGLIPPYSEN